MTNNLETNEVKRFEEEIEVKRLKRKKLHI